MTNPVVINGQLNIAETAAQPTVFILEILSDGVNI